MYDLIEKQFSDHLTTSQHGFVKKRSVVSNMLCFLNDVQVKLERNPNSVYSLYTDFSKAFDKVPHAELLIKLRRIGVGGCVLSLLKDYLRNRKQFVRFDGVRSRLLQVSCGVPQGFILCPLLFCIFINDLPTSLISSTPYLYAKFLFIDKSNQEFQKEFDRISLWVSRNRMSLAAEKCCYIAFKGQSLSLTMNNTTLEQSTKVTDLGVQLTGTLKTAKYLEFRLAKANRTFGFLKRILSKNMEKRVKICAYKSLILPLITFASSTWHPSPGSMRLVECFQKRALKWITGYRNASYFENMVSLRLLPLPMFLQLNDFLLLSKLYHDKENALPLIETYELQYGRVKSRLFKIPKLRTEKFRENFYFRTAKVANNLPEEIDFSTPLGLKGRILSFMWDRLMLNFNERVVCTWTIFCDCSDCRKYWNQDQIFYGSYPLGLMPKSHNNNNNNNNILKSCKCQTNNIFLYNFHSKFL